MNPDGSFADLFDLSQRVWYDNDRGSLRLNLTQLVEALRLDVRIADCQNLVNQKDIRIHIDGDRECQAHIHTGGIGAHRIIQEFLQF